RARPLPIPTTAPPPMPACSLCRSTTTSRSSRRRPATQPRRMSGQVDVGWAGAPFGVTELEAGKIRLIMKSSDAPDCDKQISRVIIANADELKARPDVFARFMRGYRDSLAFVYSTPAGLAAYATFAKLPEAAAKRALQEFLPPAAVDPDRISGI